MTGDADRTGTQPRSEPGTARPAVATDFRDVEEQRPTTTPDEGLGRGRKLHLRHPRLKRVPVARGRGSASPALCGSPLLDNLTSTPEDVTCRRCVPTIGTHDHVYELWRLRHRQVEAGLLADDAPSRFVDYEKWYGQRYGEPEPTSPVVDHEKAAAGQTVRGRLA